MKKYKQTAEIQLLLFKISLHKIKSFTFFQAYYTCSNSSSIYTEDFFSITENK